MTEVAKSQEPQQKHVINVNQPAEYEQEERITKLLLEDFMRFPSEIFSVIYPCLDFSLFILVS